MLFFFIPCASAKKAGEVFPLPADIQLFLCSQLCADFLLQRLQHLVMDLVDVLILERALGGLERDAQRDGLLAFLDMLARMMLRMMSATAVPASTTNARSRDTEG